MSNREALVEIEKLLAVLTDEKTWDGMGDGQIAQVMKLKMWTEMRETCYRIETKVDEQILEFKALLKIKEIRERLDLEIRRAIG